MSEYTNSNKVIHYLIVISYVGHVFKFENKDYASVWGTGVKVTKCVLITYSKLRRLDKLNFRWLFCASCVIFNSKIENIYFFLRPGIFKTELFFNFYDVTFNSTLRCIDDILTIVFFLPYLRRLVISQWTWNKTYHRVSICLIYEYFTGKGHWW